MMATQFVGWKCEGCGGAVTDRPWNCPGCGKEVCENCFSKMMHCELCSALNDEPTLAAAADEMYGTEFSEIVNPKPQSPQ